MLKERTEILKNRPYFGGEKNTKQVRALSEIRLYENLISFNIYSGACSLLHVVALPIKLKGSWCAYFEEVGTYGRVNHAKRISLAEYSVIPYNNGVWESSWCLLKTNIRNPKKIHINTKKYQPQYY